MTFLNSGAKLTFTTVYIVYFANMYDLTLTNSLTTMYNATYSIPLCTTQPLLPNHMYLL